MHDDRALCVPGFLRNSPVLIMSECSEVITFALTTTADMFILAAVQLMACIKDCVLLHTFQRKRSFCM